MTFSSSFSPSSPHFNKRVEKNTVSEKLQTVGVERRSYPVCSSVCNRVAILTFFSFTKRAYGAKSGQFLRTRIQISVLFD